MREIIICADTTCDIPYEYAGAHNIRLIPVGLTIADKFYYDREISNTEFYTLLLEKKTLAKTSAISIGEFDRFFKEILDQDKDIFFISFSSKTSINYDNAVKSSKNFDSSRIIIMDAHILCIAFAGIVLKAQEFRDQGDDLKTIEQKIYALRDNVQLEFAAGSLLSLYKGGRCSGLAYYLGSLLHFIPIIRMLDGEVKMNRKVRGKMQVAVDSMYNALYKDYKSNNLDLSFPIIIGSSLDPISIEYLKRKIETEIKVEPLTYEIGIATSSHSGKGTVGVAWRRLN